MSILMSEDKKKLLGTNCPSCKKGQLKKKHNRQVTPAKPFIGCSNYPNCTYSLEVNDEIEAKVKETGSYSGSVSESDEGYKCRGCGTTYDSIEVELNDMDDCPKCGAGLVQNDVYSSIDI